MPTEHKPDVTIVETDPLGRIIVWRHSKNIYTVAQGSDRLDALHAPVHGTSQYQFALAYWRNWNQHRSK